MVVAAVVVGAVVVGADSWLLPVKQIAPAAMLDSDAVARFGREALLLSALDHPGSSGCRTFAPDRPVPC